MQILDNLIIVSLIVGAFFAGMYVSGRFNAKSAIEVKEALEKQYLRLRAKADADDPCRPYVAPRVLHPVPKPTGDFDGDKRFIAVGCTDEKGNPTVRPYDVINKEFVDELKANGKAKIAFKKSDVAK